MAGKRTLVIGASTNPSRYSNIAINRLVDAGHEVIALGLKPGEVAGIPIQTYPEPWEKVDTITMYVGASRQIPFYNYILSLKPKRVIFNPGAESEELEQLLSQHNIEVLEACTLVMLATNQY